MIYNERTPFIIKQIDDPSIIEDELCINPVDNLLYIYKNNGNHIGVSKQRVLNIIKNTLSKYIGSLSSSQIQELVNKSNELYKWMQDNDNDNINTPESNILNIFKVFNGINPGYTLKSIISGMVDKEQGKGLTDYSFKLEDMLKISGINEDANYYVHPEALQCNLGSKVEAVIINGESRTGHISINKEDIGYGGVEYNANYYEHPRPQQCSAGVNSINNKKGYIELTKTDFGIRNLPNIPPANYNDYANKSNNRLFLGSTAVEYMNNKLVNIMVRNNTEILPQYKVEFTSYDNNEIRSVEIGGISHTEFINNKMVFNVYHNNVIVSVIDRRRENTVIYPLFGLIKGTTKRVQYTAGKTLIEV